MDLDTDRLLSTHNEKRPSPLRVRIPPNPHASSGGNTPSKSDAHVSNTTLRERLHNKYIMSATTLLLLFLLAFLYSKTGVQPVSQYTPDRQGDPATHQYESAAPSWQTFGADAKDAAVLTPASFSDKQQALEASASHKDLPQTEVAAQLSMSLSTQQESTTKAVVVAQHREDIGWLSALPSHIHQYIYQADNATAERSLRVNQGETAVYLQYIVEQYHNLPDIMVFMHAHQDAPHMPDKLDLVNKLRWDAFGYANLRYTNITYDLWGKWTGDWLCPQNPLERPPSEEIIWDDLRVNQSRLFAEMQGKMVIVATKLHNSVVQE
ncbi:hypothetical protein WJX82_006644 [Trebouxia sp. C0006]